MVLVPLNTRLAAAELVAIVRAARPALLVTDRDPGALAGEVDRIVTFDEWDALDASATLPAPRPRTSTRTTSPSSTSRAARPGARRA